MLTLKLKDKNKNKLHKLVIYLWLYFLISTTWHL